MKTRNQTFSIEPARQAVTETRAAIAAVLDNEQALAREHESGQANIDSVSLDDLEKQEAIVAEEGKRAVRIKIRESALARLRTAVMDTTKGLFIAFAELQGEINDSVAEEKKAFHAAFQEFISPMVRHYGGPLDESILWRLSSPYERLLDSIQSMGNISAESERDAALRANFYLTRTEMLLGMIADFEKQGRKWFAAPTD